MGTRGFRRWASRNLVVARAAHEQPGSLDRVGHRTACRGPRYSRRRSRDERRAGRRRPGVRCARSPRPGARAVEEELVLAGRLGGPDPGRDHRRPRGVVAVGARDQRAPPGRSPETQDGFALDPLLCARDVRHRSGTRWHRLVAAGSAVDVRAVGGPPLDRLVRARTHDLGSRSN